MKPVHPAPPATKFAAVSAASRPPSAPPAPARAAQPRPAAAPPRGFAPPPQAGAARPQPPVAPLQHGVAQLHQHADDMRKRRRFKRSLKTAIRRILALGAAGPATLAQINIHDEVQHAGQHHGFRNVTVAQLVNDIKATIAAQTALNLVDSDNP